MAIQMRDECSANSASLDLDEVLRNLQNRIPATSEFTQIGPFRILPLTIDCRNCNHDFVAQNGGISDDIMEKEPRASTAELHLVLDNLSWDQLDDFQAWYDIGQECAAKTANIERDLEESAFLHQELLPNSLDHPELICQPNSAQDDLNVLDLSNPAVATLDMTTSLNTYPEAETTILTMSNEANISQIPAEARLLLDYYSCRIIDVMSMSPGSKPPWRTIHLPCAMSALAELMVYGEIRSFSKMALFHALLSVSLYHMGSAQKDSSSQYWLEMGYVHKQKAQNCLRTALTKDLPKSSRGKYKEILMSYLSMVTIGVCDTSHARDIV